MSDGNLKCSPRVCGRASFEVLTHSLYPLSVSCQALRQGNWKPQLSNRSTGSCQLSSAQVIASLSSLNSSSFSAR